MNSLNDGESKLWRRPKKRWLFGIPLGGFLLFGAGIVFWGGFNWSLELSNTEAFCTSCHEMRDFVFAEYKETIHYSNRTGVRATCPDCHVPKQWIYKVMRKIRASNELYHKIMGTVSTREKFEANRLEMAKRVWAAMKSTDSRECRNCHELEHMNLELQGKSARRRHTVERQRERGETCIDCHQGIAHHLPKDYEG